VSHIPPEISTEPTLMLRGGTELTHKECTVALDAALLIIESVGTTGIEHKHQQAEQWLTKYYPAWK